jgi:hypothetical protein
MKSAADAVEREEERQRARTFSVAPDLDGTYIVRGRLTPEQGAILMRAIEAAGDVLFREETHGQAYESRVPVPAPAHETQAAAARRRADAVALLAECALGAGFGARRLADAEGEAELNAGAARMWGTATADATGTRRRPPRPTADATPFPLSGSRAGRYQVMLHVELDALREDDPTCGAGCSHLDDGVRVSHETSRRISCDSAVVPLYLDADGRILDAGHSRRVVSPALRRALEARDRGCRFPGCGLRYTEAHHIRHWADGGETSLENCVLLCRHHHGLLHEGGWKMESLPGGRLSSATPTAAPTTTAAGSSPASTSSAATSPCGSSCARTCGRWEGVGNLGVLESDHGRISQSQGFRQLGGRDTQVGSPPAHHALEPSRSVLVLHLVRRGRAHPVAVRTACHLRLDPKTRLRSARPPTATGTSPISARGSEGSVSRRVPSGPKRRRPRNMGWKPVSGYSRSSWRRTREPSLKAARRRELPARGSSPSSRTVRSSSPDGAKTVTRPAWLSHTTVESPAKAVLMPWNSPGPSPRDPMASRNVPSGS